MSLPGATSAPSGMLEKLGYQTSGYSGRCLHIQHLAPNCGRQGVGDSTRQLLGLGETVGTDCFEPVNGSFHFLMC